MRALRIAVVISAFAGMGLVSARDCLAQATSPNGFVRNWCTWFTDWRAFDYGWNLHFVAGSNRNAYNWANVITNARCNVGPVRGAIMVIGPWSGNSLGHVAMVESIASNGRWLVSQTSGPGFPAWPGQPFCYRGATAYYTWWEYTPGSGNRYVRRLDNNCNPGSSLPLVAFLTH